MLRRALASLPQDSASEALITYRLVEVLLHLDDAAALAALADELAGEGALRMQRARTDTGRAVAGGRPAGRAEGSVGPGWSSPIDPQPELLADAAVAFDRLWAEAERNGGFDLWWRVGHAALTLGRDADAEAAFQGKPSRVWPRPRSGRWPRNSRTSAPPSIATMSSMTQWITRSSPPPWRCPALILLPHWTDRTPGPPRCCSTGRGNSRLCVGSRFAILAGIPRQHQHVECFDARYGTLDLKAYGDRSPSACSNMKRC